MRYLILISSFFISILIYGQTVYKPTIVVLDPYQTKYDSLLLKEIKTFSRKSKPGPKEEKERLESLKKEELNIQKMKRAEWEFSNKIDYASTFTLSLYLMLSYAVSDQTDQCLIFPSHDTSYGEINHLKAIAKKNDVLWVVNPVILHAYVKNGKKYSTARLQVYDAKNNKIVIDKEYTGDTKNPGFELSCENGTLECTINNIINPVLNDILLAVLGHYQH